MTTSEPDERDSPEPLDFDRLVRPPTGAVKPIRDVPDLYVFRFEVGPAVLAQLLEKLRTIPLRPLQEAVEDTPYPGFYQIYLAGTPKYIGKTARPIQTRLREHVTKLYGRRGIRLADVGCKYAFVEDPSLVDVSEGALIDFFAENNLAEWNQTGFGSKVTGYRRGRQIASAWAEQFPPDFDLPVEAGADEPISLYRLYQQLKAVAPLTFSLPGGRTASFREAHPDSIGVPIQTLPFREWIARFESLLGVGWHVERQAESWYVVRRDRE